MMVIEIAKWTIITFGIFFIVVGGVMLIKPKISRETLRKAGSTDFINYAEKMCIRDRNQSDRGRIHAEYSSG